MVRNTWMLPLLPVQLGRPTFSRQIDTEECWRGLYAACRRLCQISGIASEHLWMIILILKGSPFSLPPPALLRSELLQVINSNKHLSKLVPCVRQHLAAIAAPGAKGRWYSHWPEASSRFWSLCTVIICYIHLCTVKILQINYTWYQLMHTGKPLSTLSPSQKNARRRNRWSVCHMQQPSDWTVSPKSLDK